MYFAAGPGDMVPVAFSDLPPATADALEARRRQEDRRVWQLIAARPPHGYLEMSPADEWVWHRALLEQLYGPLEPVTPEQRRLEIAEIDAIIAAMPTALMSDRRPHRMVLEW